MLQAHTVPGYHLHLPPCHSRRSMVVTQQTTEPVATLDLTISLANRCLGLDDRVGHR